MSGDWICEFLSGVIFLAIFLYLLGYLPVYWFFFARPLPGSPPGMARFKRHLQAGLLLQPALWGLAFVCRWLRRPDGWALNIFGYVGHSLPNAAILFGIVLNGLLLFYLSAARGGQRRTGLDWFTIAILPLISLVVVVREIRMENRSGPFDGHFLQLEFLFIHCLLVSGWLLMRRSRELLERSGAAPGQGARCRLSRWAGAVALLWIVSYELIPNF